MATLKVYDGDLGDLVILVRCDLRESSAPVEVDYGTGDGWQTTRWQAADCRHTWGGLRDIGKRLAAESLGLPLSTCEVYITDIDPSDHVHVGVTSTHCAVWDGGAYACGMWRSQDGTDWTDVDGQAVECREFADAIIRLEGGPKSGLIVR